MTSRRCCGGCGCRTSAATPPRSIATAKAQRWEPVEVLEPCSIEEAAGRERSALATRRAAAGFPTGKTFDAWNPERVLDPGPDPAGAADPGMGAPPGEPGRLRPVRDRQDVLPRSPRASTPSNRDCKVAWFTLEDLGVLLRRHRADDTVTKAIARILRADLVVVDDIGLLPVAQRRRRRPLPPGRRRLRETLHRDLSSNLHPAAFDELMPKTLATATVDRLLHHAHVCQTTGDSVRLTQALDRARGDPADLTTPATDGQPLGRSRGHHRADLVTVNGQVSRPPLGRNQWPLTARRLHDDLPSCHPPRLSYKRLAAIPITATPACKGRTARHACREPPMLEAFRPPIT